MNTDRHSGDFRPSWTCWGVLLISAALIKPAQDYVESRKGDPGLDPDLLYFSSPSAIKRMALGYDCLLGDFYWMRAIQYYGRREEADRRAVRYKNLSTLLDITTTLNPDLLDAYRSGSLFLAEPDPIGAGQPLDAVKLLEKGMRAHPKEWRLPYDKGFIYFLFLKDYRAAGDAWLSASRLPEAPPWVEGLAAMSLSKGGAMEVAIALWQRQLEESDRANIRENARNHLLSIQAARDLWTLEDMLEKYKLQYGSLPANMNELARGLSRRLPRIDPLGTPYEYDPETGKVKLSPESKVKYLEVPESYKQDLR